MAPKNRQDLNFKVLFLSGPLGFLMAFYRSSGIAAKIAFVLLALFWWVFTYLTYITVRKKQLVRHGEYMLRSYAFAFSVITLRVATYLVSWYKPQYSISYPDEAYSLLCFPNYYILEAWLSWIVSWAAAELQI